MKIFLRILAILAVSLVVVGAAVAVTSLGGSSSVSSQAQGITQQARFDTGGQRPDGAGGRGGGSAGLTGLLSNLFSVGWVVAAVVVVMQGWKRLQAASSRRRIGPTPAS
jgi:hypothetical protein